jgi:hypothetical protein
MFHRSLLNHPFRRCPENPERDRAQSHQFGQKQGGCRLFRQIDDPRLQFLDFLGVLAGEVGRLRGIPRKIEEFGARRQKGRPNELPILWLTRDCSSATQLNSSCEAETRGRVKGQSWLQSNLLISALRSRPAHSSRSQCRGCIFGPTLPFDEERGLALASGSLAACCVGLLTPSRFLR